MNPPTSGCAVPVRLDVNCPPVFYAGGAKISAFRGEGAKASGPEDWVASTVLLPNALLPPGSPLDLGVSQTPGGAMTELISKDLMLWLGPALAERYDGNPALLVKLLDAGERLPVHCHPSREFARRHLGSIFGKTEGWIVLDSDPGARVWIGMKDDVGSSELRGWIGRGDVDTMLAAMNEVVVAPGDVIYVPAGLPHSIGPGVMVAELQEPTTMSIIADHHSFGVDEDFATLGLGWEVALSCFDLAGYGRRLDELIAQPELLPSGPGCGGLIYELFPSAANPYFRALRIDCVDRISLPDPAFAVLIVTGGSGDLLWADDSVAIAAGQTLAVPYGLGAIGFRGRVQVLVCLPPSV